MADMFSNAVAYEKLMGRWSMRLAPLFLDFAQIHNGTRVLDVGCGTGSLVHALADRRPDAEVTGIDPSEPAIDFCRKRFAGSRGKFDCGNAMSLPYGDNAFDHSLSLLVFQFISEPKKASQEMRRVTVSGGTVSACTWDSVGGGLEMSAIFWQEAAALDQALAETRAESSPHCNKKGALEALWHDTGLERVVETAIEFRTDFTGFDDYWLPFTLGVGPFGVYMDRLSAEHRDALRDQLRRRLLSNGLDRPFSLGARAWAVRGLAPA